MLSLHSLFPIRVSCQALCSQSLFLFLHLFSLSPSTSLSLSLFVVHWVIDPQNTFCIICALTSRPTITSFIYIIFVFLYLCIYHYIERKSIPILHLPKNITTAPSCFLFTTLALLLSVTAACLALLMVAKSGSNVRHLCLFFFLPCCSRIWGALPCEASSPPIFCFLFFYSGANPCKTV